ncbi:MAG: cysteine hydrolase [Desulfobacteraceae bacterium]|nr:cysteine hydrolase [Desulfobacteraceae bacterium]
MASIAMLVIDMQQGVFDALPRFDAKGVIERINRLAERVRAANGTVLFIQHDGPKGDVLEPGTDGWEFLATLNRRENDPVIRKTACDAFLGTGLADTLDRLKATTLIITGCATDFCVDTTLRSATSRGFDVLVPTDAHTTGDRLHLDAKTIIAHHNFMWENLILPEHPVKAAPAREIQL